MLAFLDICLMVEGVIKQRLKVAVALHNQGELIQAKAIYREVLAVDPDNYYAIRYLGCLCRLLSHYEEGIALLRKAVSLRPADADCLYNLGNILASSGSHQEAISILDRCVELRQDFADAMQSLGFSLLEISSFARAEEVLVSAVKINPLLFGAWLNLGNAFREQKKYLKAIKSYKKAIEVKPDFVDAYIQLFGAYNCVGDFQNALTSLLECLEIDESCQIANLQIGAAFFRANKKEDAIRYFSSRCDKFNFALYSNLFKALDGRIPAKMLENVDVKGALVKDVLSKLGVSEIAAFGDSHVNVFNDIPGIVVSYLGPSTAYNLSSATSSSGGGRLLSQKLAALDPAKSAVILSFGEIDCRAHIVKQAHLQCKTIRDIAVVTANIYFDLVLKVKEYGFRVILYGPHGSGSQVDSFGCETDRNFAVQVFNEHLAELCTSHDIYFFSLSNLLIDSTSLLTRRTWLTDDVHLPSSGFFGDQIKALLLSRLLLSIQGCAPSYESRADQRSEDFLVDVRAFAVPIDDTKSLAYACLSRQGIIEWKTDFDDCLKLICFDLGSSYVLKSAYISFQSGINLIRFLRFEIDGVNLESLNTVGVSEGGLLVNFPKEAIGRFLVVSGEKGLSEIKAMRFVPVPVGR